MEENIQEIADLFDSILKKFSNEQAQIQEFLKIQSLFKGFDFNILLESGNHHAGGFVLTHVLKYLKKIEKIAINSGQKSNKILKKKFTINIEKLKYLMKHIKTSFNLAKDDFNCLPDHHERKIAVKQITTTVYIKNKEELHKLGEKISRLSNIIGAVMYKTLKYNQSASRNLMTGWYTIYYSIFAKKKAKILAKLFNAVISSEKAAIFWKLVDSKLFSKILSMEFPPIKVNTMIFIPRLSNNVLDSTYYEIKNNHQRRT